MLHFYASKAVLIGQYAGCGRFWGRRGCGRGAAPEGFFCLPKLFSRGLCRGWSPNGALACARWLFPKWRSRLRAVLTFIQNCSLASVWCNICVHHAFKAQHDTIYFRVACAEDGARIALSSRRGGRLQKWRSRLRAVLTCLQKCFLASVWCILCVDYLARLNMTPLTHIHWRPRAGALLDLLGASLGASLGPLGPCWCLPGPSWAALGLPGFPGPDWASGHP